MERRVLAQTLRNARPFFLIAGPCVLESERVVMEIATRLAALQKELQIPVIFKASFDKANRQDLTRYLSRAWTRGRAAVAAAREAHDGAACAHGPARDVPGGAGGEGRRHSADPGVFEPPDGSARRGRQIGQACEPQEGADAVGGDHGNKRDAANDASWVVVSVGATDFILTERGSMFGYGDLVVDARNLPKLRSAQGMVVQDVTHSVQRPTQAGAVTSGGDREFIPTIARMAAAVGVDGFFMETHPDPDSALCDASTMLPLDQLQLLVEELIAIANASKALPHKTHTHQ
ncbi:3-deoxy-8-phosphooctulonate synthase, partial [Globisporangium splendens]